MDGSYSLALQMLKQAGWQIEMYRQPQALPVDVGRRYPWLPAPCLELISEAKSVVSSTRTAWLNTVEEFRAPGATAWNEWERRSLEAAGRDHALRSEIVRFWDNHFPLFMSVKSGFAYFAIERSTLRIVRGQEPEFESPHFLATSVLELLHLLQAPAKLERWV